jgi:hypothetical protein
MAYFHNKAACGAEVLPAYKEYNKNSVTKPVQVVFKSVRL